MKHISTFLTLAACMLSAQAAPVILVLVDACRDNPLKSKGRSVGTARGLSAIEPPKGQIVVYSASRGQQALDRLGEKDANPNGVFTREFIARMKKPGVKIEDLMREVQDSVEALAKTVNHEQRPAIYNEARGNFYFFGPTTVQVQGSAAADDSEAQAWAAAQQANSNSGYQAYLDAFSQGRYVVAAKIAMQGLRPPSAQPGKFSNPAATTGSKPAPGRTEDAETAFWNEVKSSGAREYLDAYLKQYPKGKYLALARIDLKKIDDNERVERARQAAEKRQAFDHERQQAERTERAVWESAKTGDSLAAYASYLDSYPQGQYAALAEAARKRVRRETAEREEDASWRVAQAANDSVTVQTYLNRYPGGRYLAQAQVRIADLKNKEAERNANSPMPLSARYSTVGNYPITDCVKDKNSGLTWEGKPTSGLRDGSKTYTNYGDHRTGDASAYVATVNAANLCSYTDWRLPTKDELRGLVVQGVTPTIDGTWFPNTQSGPYWTSSPLVGNANFAWNVNFYLDFVDKLHRGVTSPVRLVR